MSNKKNKLQDRQHPVDTDLWALQKRLNTLEDWVVTEKTRHHAAQRDVLSAEVQKACDSDRQQFISGLVSDYTVVCPKCEEIIIGRTLATRSFGCRTDGNVEALSYRPVDYSFYSAPDVQYLKAECACGNVVHCRTRDAQEEKNVSPD